MSDYVVNRYRVTYKDLRNGGSFDKVEKHWSTETYEEFVKRLQNEQSKFDFPFEVYSLTRYRGE